MKLTTTTMVTLDGVMQGLGGSDEDRRGGFERGGWVGPYNDEQGMAFLNEVYGRADTFLLGRRTFEIFAASWGTWPDPGDSPIWTALNTRPKYVATTTPFDPEWSDTTVLSGDVAADIRELKGQAGGELEVHGSGVLIRWLLANDLSTRSTCSPSPWSSARGRGCSLTPARTSRSSWWDRRPSLPAG